MVWSKRHREESPPASRDSNTYLTVLMVEIACSGTRNGPRVLGQGMPSYDSDDSLFRDRRGSFFNPLMDFTNRGAEH